MRGTGRLTDYGTGIRAARALLACYLAGLVGTALAAESPQVVVDSNSITLHMDGRPVGRYRYSEVPFKPYLQELRTPSGINILRDSPFDHKHHHALMFAVAVEGVNFWEEKEGHGRQQHAGINGTFVGELGGTACAAFTERLAWMNGNQVLLTETRTIRLMRDPVGKATLLSWTAALQPWELGPRPSSARLASVTLSGANYFGLGMRFLTSMDKSGRFINAEGGEGVPGTNDKRSRWCAYSAEAEGKPVTVAIFDHPGNVRHPATWFTMLEPFSYLCVTLGLHHEPLKLSNTATKPPQPRGGPPQEPVVVPPRPLIYGVGLWDGRVEAEEIERLYQQWVSLMIMPEGMAKPAQTATAPAGEEDAGTRRHGDAGK
jgi:hypothetical protein